MRLLFLVALLTTSLCSRAVTRDLILAFQDAEKLADNNRHDQAKAAYREVVEQALTPKEGAAHYAFSAYYGMTYCAYKLMQHNEVLLYAQKALDLAAAHRSDEWATRFGCRYNEVELMGLMERAYHTQARFGMGWQQNRKASALYRAAFLPTAQTSQPLSPREVRMAPAGYRAVGWRLVEREADYLFEMCRTEEALALLTEAIKESKFDLESTDSKRSFYPNKLLGALATIEGFLGYHRRAAQTVEMQYQKRVGWDRQGELSNRLNYLYDITRLEGATDATVASANELLAEAKRIGVKDMSGFIRVHTQILSEKMTSEERLANLLAATKASKAEDDAVEHFYSTRERLFERADQNENGLDTEFQGLLLQTRSQGNLRAEPRIYGHYAEWLHRQNRHAESISMFQEALRMTKRYHWNVKSLQFYAQLGAAFLASGQPEQAFATWADMKRFETAHADLPPEIILLHRKVQLMALLRAGRVEEARAFAIPWRAYGTQHNLADKYTAPFSEAFIAAFIEKENIVPRAVADTSIAPLILHPSEIATVSLDNTPAVSAVFLMNPRLSRISGLLKAQGAALEFKRSGRDNNMTIQSSRGVIMSLDIPITLDGGEMIKIHLSSAAYAQAHPDPKFSIQLQWTDASGTPGASSQWLYEWDKATSETTVLEAARVESNPFVGLPVQHHLHIPEGAPAAVPFRVRADIAFRIEYREPVTGDLIAIDNNGNGIFTEPGDFWTPPKNTDTATEAPTVMAEIATKTGAIEVWYWSGSGSLENGDVKLHVELFLHGKWETHAVDVLRRKNPSP